MKLILLGLLVSIISFNAFSKETKIFQCQLQTQSDSTVLPDGWVIFVQDRLATSVEEAEMESVNAVIDKYFGSMDLLEIDKLPNAEETYHVKMRGQGFRVEKKIKANCKVKIRD